MILSLYTYILGRMTKMMKKSICPAHFVVLHISCIK